jgi:hypothetical protein
MAIPQTNVSWSGLQTEFGGANPINATEYRRGYYIPDLTSNSGVPNTNLDLAASKWRGTTKQNYYSNLTMFDTVDTLVTAASLFSGLDAGYTWYTLNSVDYTTITMPDVAYPLKLYVSGGSVQIGGGYRYYNPGCDLYGCGSTVYYYDRMKNPGVRIYNASGSTLIAECNSTNLAEVNYTTNGGSTENRYWQGFSITVSPNTSYRLYYRCDFYSETGNNYFAWYGLTPPFCYGYNY